LIKRLIREYNQAIEFYNTGQNISYEELWIKKYMLLQGLLVTPVNILLKG
jgi:hypothetical protein